MIEPGPSDEELMEILTAAARVPDHGKLEPWRFMVFRGDARQELGKVIAESIQREDPSKSAELLNRLREFPLRAPKLVVVTSTPNTDSKIPLWEQHLSAGAACQNLLLAATALGYAVQWLTGPPAYSPGVQQFLGLEACDRIAGFIFIGSPTDKPLQERPRPAFANVVSWH
ncbi:MAG: nitroreductase [Pseudomonadota bacterium]